MSHVDYTRNVYENYAAQIMELGKINYFRLGLQ